MNEIFLVFDLNYKLNFRPNPWTRSTNIWKNPGGACPGAVDTLKAIYKSPGVRVTHVSCDKKLWFKIAILDWKSLVLQYYSYIGIQG